jgi:hypothetical protein
LFLISIHLSKVFSLGHHLLSADDRGVVASAQVGTVVGFVDIVPVELVECQTFLNEILCNELAEKKNYTLHPSEI